MELQDVATWVSEMSVRLVPLQSALFDWLEPLFLLSTYLTPLLDGPARLLSSIFLRMPQQPRDIDMSDPAVSRAIIVIAAAPLLWNAIARLEYRTRFMTKMCFGRKYIACYMLALWIFAFSLFRDKMVIEAIKSQPQSEVLDRPELTALSGAMFVTGVTLVTSAYFKLGIAGTYLGDYFDILFDERIGGFPFNITEHPMYDGSSLLFFSKALTLQSMTGLLLACWVYIVYRIASVAEGAFTDYIYAEATRKRKAAINSSLMHDTPQQTLRMTAPNLSSSQDTAKKTE